ncbi:hypothetical protein BG004_003975 [Podila humilis]|nr:hypothetical protein BG004_003975 [Podila humilis]
MRSFMTLSAALTVMVTVSTISVDHSGCTITKGSSMCSAIQYLTTEPSAAVAEKRIQAYFYKIPSALSLQTPCITALQEALCLLEFPKCAGQTHEVLPVCWSVRDHVAQLCYEPFNHSHSPSEATSSQHVDGDENVTLEQIRDGLFTPSFNHRWAASAAVQEPDCVSFQDHGLGSSPLENIQMVSDVTETSYIEFKANQHEEERWLKEQSATDLDTDQAGLFEYNAEYPDEEDKREFLQTKNLDKRSRVRHHHHKSNSNKKSHKRHGNNNNVKRADGPQVAQGTEGKIDIAIRADKSDQAVYAASKESGDESVLVQTSLHHAETKKDASAQGHQRILAQSGTGNSDAAKAADSLGKASSGHPVDATKEEKEDEAAHPKKGTVLLAAVPILLIMGAIAGFTVYRRYYENSFNQGGRNDTHDPIPGSPIHFDRTFLNTIHSPPPTATYLHDPENNSSRHQSPSSVASAGNMKRPPPSAGSHGKTRFQELSRSYDFGAGFRSMKNALSRSSNNSRDGALDKSASASASHGSLNGKNIAFGAGGHSIAKIGSHPGLNALDRQQLQQQYGSNMANSSGSGSSRFPDVNTVNVLQEHSIVWGQYSADDNGVYHDAASTLATNLARKSASSNSLSGGKYSHHHQQSSGHQPGTPTDSIGDCLSPESPSMSREELMRRREMFAPAYTFGSEGSAATDSHSGTDLLFDGRDHFFDISNEKALDATLHDEEMDMYLSMEKEESPYDVDDYNSMNPAPYEPKVVYRHSQDPSLIQKSAPFSEKVEDGRGDMAGVRPSISIDRSAVVNQEFDEKKALQAADEKEEDAAIAVQETGAEETHVLGNASPEWKPTPMTAQQVQAIDRLSANAALRATAAALGSQSRGVAPLQASSGSLEFDPAEWEEDPRSTSKASLANSTGGGNGGGGGKGGKKKNKAKKGRKH